MKRSLQLNEIKAISLGILKHFKSFCEENDLQFYLSNGTLLGAIKYKGFIPWDDDIDVLMPREDYDKFLEVYCDSEKYRLFSRERVAKFKFPFAKLCDMTTIKEEDNIDNGVSLGVDIDIFPLDNCTLHICEPGIQKRITANYLGCCLSKFKSTGKRAFYKRWIIRYCQYRGFDHFHQKLSQIVKKETSFGETHKGCLIWPVYGKREILPAEVFSDTVWVEFEGERFPAPIGYDAYLRSLYGAYEKDPPREKQKTHHDFKAYDNRSS